MANKTQVICTIGPVSQSEEEIEQLLHAGMSVARLNLIHETFDIHKKRIETVRKVSKNMGKYTIIAADLPGPKMRIGKLEESINLKQGELFTLTLDEIIGNKNKVYISFDLTNSVKPGDTVYLNDGFLQLQVEYIDHPDIVCKVVIGGVLTSNKGVNVPNINLGVDAFTEFDLECLKFAAENQIELINQSFVEAPKDIAIVRRSANDMNYHPIIFAKIERSNAVRNINSILEVADGIMVARGDLGVETPIEQIAIIQKYLIQQAKEYNKGTIVATQMLESMVSNCRPTRAESTDVANAVLDGADFVMLSEESAMGSYAKEATEMLSKIIGATSYYTTRTKINSIF